MTALAERLVKKVKFEMVVPHYYHHHGALKRYKKLLRYSEDSYPVQWNGRINDEVFGRSVEFEPDQRLQLELLEVPDQRILTSDEVRQFFIDGGYVMWGAQALTMLHRSKIWPTIPRDIPIISPTAYKLLRAGHPLEGFAGIMKSLHTVQTKKEILELEGTTVDMFCLDDVRYPKIWFIAGRIL